MIIQYKETSQHKSLLVAETNYANDQINSRLSKLLEQMEISETKLLAYKKENNLIDIGDVKKLKIDQIKSVSKRIIDANRDLQKKQKRCTTCPPGSNFVPSGAPRA